MAMPLQRETYSSASRHPAEFFNSRCDGEVNLVLMIIPIQVINDLIFPPVNVTDVVIDHH